MITGSRLSRLFALGNFCAALLFAGNAGAVSITKYYVELLTPNARAQVDIDSFPSDLFSIDYSAHTTSEATGLGHVGFGQSIAVWEHEFDPSYSVYGVNDVHLAILLLDDVCVGGSGCGPSDLVDLFSQSEVAQVFLESSFWQSGNALFNLLHGDITVNGLIQNAGDHFTVTTFSSQGDFFVAASALKVSYETGEENDQNGPPIPEPSAALVFGLGALLVGIRRSHKA